MESKEWCCPKCGLCVSAHRKCSSTSYGPNEIGTCQLAQIEYYEKNIKNLVESAKPLPTRIYAGSNAVVTIGGKPLKGFQSITYETNQKDVKTEQQRMDFYSELMALSNKYGLVMMNYTWKTSDSTGTKNIDVHFVEVPMVKKVEVHASVTVDTSKKIAQDGTVDQVVKMIKDNCARVMGKCIADSSFTEAMKRRITKELYLEKTAKQWKELTEQAYSLPNDIKIDKEGNMDFVYSNKGFKIEPKLDILAQRKKDGLCPECGDKGSWINCAAVCPVHGKFIG